MTEYNENKTNPIAYIVCVILAFIAFFYGSQIFSNYNMMKKANDKVEFLQQNNAPQYEVCRALSWALSVSKQIQNQKQFDVITAKIRQEC
ncbi:hypothetical protein B9T31_04110 [Acinetobacter sp. ANC 4558]|uniref:hypothetical protein n=1 Tax=Acinetobacter sp. ANC 4558 TaxID=1977876 RepID=UPI000A350168|nr:hypothetical protein [Acinetobacter sp. ANC 4558]OTG87689.1 hypothetical protein B9T31_04110 [Acinetobacter sp. ANC 4558]